MSQAKTEEQVAYINDVLLKDVSVWSPDAPCAGIHIDDWISFDKMKQIVECLEHSNESNYWNNVYKQE